MADDETATDQGDWPEWALPQLRHAVALTARIRSRGHQLALAPELYRTWFNPVIGRQIERGHSWRPLPGVYRAAHAGSGVRLVRDGITTVCRQDAIGRDGWWRTWGEQWRPRQSREHCVRIVLTPRSDALAQVVREVTAALLTERFPWMFACSIDLRRLRRPGAHVLHVPDASAVSARLLDRLGPLIRPVTPPLCLPLAPGVGLSDTPDNGMSFGELRCHLVALGLGRLSADPHGRAPLRTIADVFVEHGIDPGMPWLSRSARHPTTEPTELRR